MAGPIKIGGQMGGWTVKALEKDGSAPRYSAECNGVKGTLTYYPLSGPRTLIHQNLGGRLKRWDGLKSPSLVEVKAGRAGGSDGFFIVVPNLEKVHKLGKPPLQPPDALAALNAVADALEQFEKKGIAHGELDPWCLVKKDDGQVALLGPGLRVPPPGVDKLGIEVDPSYAAPEILDQGDPTVTADFFSLGLILFRLLTGKRTVQAKEASGAFGERGKTPAPSLDKAPVPGPMKALYAKLTASDPRQRPQTTAELKKDLALVAKGQKPTLNQVKAPEIEADRIGGVVGVLVVLLVLAGGLFFMTTSTFAVSSPLSGIEFPLDGAGYNTAPVGSGSTAPIGTKSGIAPIKS